LGVFLKDPAMAGDVPHLSEQVDLLKLQLSIDVRNFFCKEKKI